MGLVNTLTSLSSSWEMQNEYVSVLPVSIPMPLYTITYLIVYKYIFQAETNLMLKNIHCGTQVEKYNSVLFENFQGGGGNIQKNS